MHAVFDDIVGCKAIAVVAWFVAGGPKIGGPGDERGFGGRAIEGDVGAAGSLLFEKPFDGPADVVWPRLSVFVLAFIVGHESGGMAGAVIANSGVGKMLFDELHLLDEAFLQSLGPAGEVVA